MSEKIKNSQRLYETRFSFGATAAIITNLALVAGLRTGEYARPSIIGGMLVIAVADNISDAIGIHIYQESELLETREVWLSTATNFITRLMVSLTFITLVFFLPIKLAVISTLVWGALLLSVMSYMIAKDKGIKPHLAILEHLSIAATVVIASNFIGQLILERLKL